MSLHRLLLFKYVMDLFKNPIQMQIVKSLVVNELKVSHFTCPHSKWICIDVQRTESFSISRNMYNFIEGTKIGTKWERMGKKKLKKEGKIKYKIQLNVCLVTKSINVNAKRFIQNRVN